MDAGAKLRLQNHCRGLYGFALSLTRDGDEARDLVQETALKALSAKNIPEDGTAFRVWLFRILHNSWRDRIKRFDTARRSPIEDLDRDVPIGDWITLHQHKINLMAVRMSFAKLSPDHQQVLSLIDIAGLKYEEAGELLQVPKGTIMSRLARARQALLAAMDEVQVIPISASTRRLKA